MATGRNMTYRMMSDPMAAPLPPGQGWPSLPQNPYRQRQGFNPQMIGEILTNLGGGIMGLSMKRPDLAMQSFGRPLTDPRKAMMEAARFDMATQEMALRRAEAARKQQAAEQQAAQTEAYLGTLSGPDRMRAQLDPVGHMKAAMTQEGKAPGMLVQDATGNWVPNPVYMEARKELAEAGRSTVNVNTGAKVPANYQPIYNAAGELERVEPIPGGPADPVAKPRKYTPEQAGRTAAQMSGIESVRNVRDYLVDESGNVDFDKVLDMNVPVINTSIPWTEGRQRRQEFLDALSAQLRAETGAAATPAELENMAERYLPAVGDTPEAVKSKLDRLENVLKTGVGLTDPNRKIEDPVPAAPPAGAPQQIMGDDDYNSLPSGSQFIDPEGNLRVKP